MSLSPGSTAGVLLGLDRAALGCVEHTAQARLVRQRTCRHGISGTGRRCSIASNIKMYAYDDGVLLEGLLISRVDAMTTRVVPSHSGARIIIILGSCCEPAD
jgi:hypothetical protein